MGLLVVGSIALDSVSTPFGQTADALGGSAVFFAVAGAVLHPVQVVGVVGSDFPFPELDRLAQRGIDLAGVARVPGVSFRWKGKYSYDLQSRETLETRLGVFADFHPTIPPAFRAAKFVFLGNIDPELQLGVDVAQEDELRRAERRRDGGVEVGEHAEPRLQRLAALEIVGILPFPPERYAGHAGHAGEVDAALREAIELREWKVGAHHTHDLHRMQHGARHREENRRAAERVGRLTEGRGHRVEGDRAHHQQAHVYIRSGALMPSSASPLASTWRTARARTRRAPSCGSPSTRYLWYQPCARRASISR